MAELGSTCYVSETVVYVRDPPEMMVNIAIRSCHSPDTKIALTSGHG